MENQMDLTKKSKLEKIYLFLIWSYWHVPLRLPTPPNLWTHLIHKQFPGKLRHKQS